MILLKKNFIIPLFYYASASLYKLKKKQMLLLKNIKIKKKTNAVFKKI